MYVGVFRESTLNFVHFNNEKIYTKLYMQFMINIQEIQEVASKVNIEKIISCKVVGSRKWRY